MFVFLLVDAGLLDAPLALIAQLAKCASDCAPSAGASSGGDAPAVIFGCVTDKRVSKSTYNMRAKEVHHCVAAFLTCASTSEIAALGEKEC